MKFYLPSVVRCIRGVLQKAIKSDIYIPFRVPHPLISCSFWQWQHQHGKKMVTTALVPEQEFLRTHQPEMSHRLPARGKPLRVLSTTRTNLCAVYTCDSARGDDLCFSNKGKLEGLFVLFCGILH